MPTSSKNDDSANETSTAKRVLAAMSRKGARSSKTVVMPTEDRVLKRSDVLPVSPEIVPTPSPPPPAPLQLSSKPTEESSVANEIMAGLSSALSDGSVVGVKVTETVVAVPSDSKKRPRFGKNPDGTPAPKVPKKEPERKSPWGKYLHQYKLEHPDLTNADAEVEARKVYTPANGKKKSFERMYTEVWKKRNPKWEKMDKEERRIAIRADFVKAI